MTDVTVVGAGPVGLSAALAARARGMETVLLEARPRGETRPGSRALFVHRATLDRLSGISPGLGEAVAARGLVWSTRRTLWGGKQVYARSYGAFASPPFTSLPQTVVEDLLREACDRAGVVSVWGDPVASVVPRRDRVLVRTGSGAAYDAAYVVGADGARSRVREQVGVALEGTTAAAEFVVVDVADGPEPAPAERVFHYRHPAAGGRNVLLVPFRGGWRVDVQCRPGDDARRIAGEPARWLPDVLPQVPDARVTWVSVYRFHQRIAGSLADATGRVLLAGEAAHLLPPFGARGMNSGITDAVEAARAVHEGDTGEYARRRRDAAERNVRAAGIALDHLLARSPVQRAAQWTAAAVAPLWPRAGRWLDSAPYGPRLRSVRY
ncbi:FAD-dependent monooxygenase [Streptomyces verrucosisporus]|uniref:FAD-dependent monooxygenase n=1 Tax=Streptomyces verrucosisporus TaxID=1695161 RepID=UPI0019D13EC7|nr:FAD-dependent monooxygenase [Streptomyces verrucosisporus]MBN3929567.1 FAD-dependent monooxygenase [Streptomyces verrucosisporus]